ncbi:EamA family transporter [Hellea sp.]|nr:EamA family transporter [Hellea sp.]
MRNDHTDSESPIRPVVLYAIAATLIITWGLAYPMVSVAVRDVSPMWLVASRTGIAAVLLVTYTKLRGHRFPSLKDKRWLWYGLMGMTGIVLPFFLFAKAQITVDSGICAIIGSAMPIFTIILAHFFANEALSWRKFIGFLIGFMGIVILFLPNNMSLELISDWRAQMLAVFAAFLYAVTTILAKRAPDTTPSLAAAMMVLCAAIVSGVMAVASGVPSELPPAIAITMLVVLGVGSTAYANILYLYVVRKTGPSTLARINYFPAIVSVAAGVWFLKEDFTWKIVIAFAVIVIGMIISRSDKKPLAPQAL